MANLSKTFSFLIGMSLAAPADYQLDSRRFFLGSGKFSGSLEPLRQLQCGTGFDCELRERRLFL